MVMQVCFLDGSCLQPALMTRSVSRRGEWDSCCESVWTSVCAYVCVLVCVVYEFVLCMSVYCV